MEQIKKWTGCMRSILWVTAVKNCNILLNVFYSTIRGNIFHSLTTSFCLLVPALEWRHCSLSSGRKACSSAQQELVMMETSKSLWGWNGLFTLRSRFINTAWAENKFSSHSVTLCTNQVECKQPSLIPSLHIKLRVSVWGLMCQTGLKCPL